MENNMKNVNENGTLEECLKKEFFADTNDARVYVTERGSNNDFSVMIMKGRFSLFTTTTELAKENDGTCCIEMTSSVLIDKKDLLAFVEKYEQQQFNALDAQKNEIISKIAKLKNALNN